MNLIKQKNRQKVISGFFFLISLLSSLWVHFNWLFMVFSWIWTKLLSIHPVQFLSIGQEWMFQPCDMELADNHDLSMQVPLGFWRENVAAVTFCKRTDWESGPLPSSIGPIGPIGKTPSRVLHCSCLAHWLWWWRW